MEWNGDEFFMKNIGVIDNYKEWLVSEQKKLMWNEYLEDVADRFTTEDWLNVVTVIGTKSVSSAKGYLREMVACGVLTTPHKGSGIYRKAIEVISNDNDEE